MEYSAQGTTAAGRYESMVGLRSTFDREAKESSKLLFLALYLSQLLVQEVKLKLHFKQ